MARFTKLKHTLLAEQVQEQIFHYIVDTPLELGAKLPNEFELGEMFGVGRSTIREAVKILSSKGIVEVRHGSGTYVLSTKEENPDPLGLKDLEDQKRLALDLVDLRLMLEPGIAELAAQNATPEDIAKLRRLCETVEQRIKNDERYLEDDIAFHTCIAECSKNKVVEQIVPIIDTAVMLNVNVTHKMLKQETVETHWAVCEAIAEGDAIGARSAMTMHLALNRNLIKKLIKMEDQE